MRPPSSSGGSRVTTLVDVAQDAGVSRATASRVLSGSPRVSPHTRDRVLASAERLHYQVNAAARSLRTARTGLVGLLIPGFRNDLYGPLADRLDERLRERGLSVVIGSSGWSSEGDLQILESFTSQRLDAVIVASRSDRSPALTAYFGSLGCPVVLLDRDFTGLQRDAVVTDLRTGIADAMTALADYGHRRIAVSAYGTDLRPGRQARAGFEEAVKSLGLESDGRLMVDISNLGGEAGDMVARQILEGNPTAAIVAGPTALLARTLRRLREQLGPNPFPSQMSVVAVGDEALADVHEPALALVTRPIRRIADSVADQLLRRLDDPSSPVQELSIPLTFRSGPSIGPPRR
jgi:LacI family transcriptional regulator